MADCPGCGRKNGDARIACVYCGAPLRDPAEAALEEVAALLPPRARGGSASFVAVLPGQEEDHVVAALSPLFGGHAHEVRLALRRPFPATFAAGSVAEGKALHEKLVEAGVAAIHYHQRHLDAVPEPTLVRSLAFPDPGGGPYRSGESALSVVTSDSQELTVDARDAVIAVVGRVALRQKTRTTQEIASAFRFRIDVKHISHTEEAERLSRRVLDLYGAAPAPLRFVDGALSVPGRVTREKPDLMRDLEAWLSRVHPRLVFVRGWEAYAREHTKGRPTLSGHSDVRKVGFTGGVYGGRAGLTFKRTEAHDLASLWDDWSARAWIVHQTLHPAGSDG